MKKELEKKLIKVCKVLFPEYKHFSINRLRNTITMRKTYIPIISWFKRKTVISISELINYTIPKQLADFKFGNEQFKHVIQQDLTRCDIEGVNKIDYFLDEINQIKYQDLYKELKLPKRSNAMYYATPEEDGFDILIEHYERKHKHVTRLSDIPNETWFYIALTLKMALALLT